MWVLSLVPGGDKDISKSGFDYCDLVAPFDLESYDC